LYQSSGSRASLQDAGARFLERGCEPSSAPSSSSSGEELAGVRTKVRMSRGWAHDMRTFVRTPASTESHCSLDRQDHGSHPLVRSAAGEAAAGMERCGVEEGE